MPDADAASLPDLRAFRWNEQARVWLLSYLWGLVYVSAQLPQCVTCKGAVPSLAVRC